MPDDYEFDRGLNPDRLSVAGFDGGLCGCQILRLPVFSNWQLMK
jgi:hypothetical protein